MKTHNKNKTRIKIDTMALLQVAAKETKMDKIFIKFKISKTF